jgi:hypothetical protein
MTDEALINFYLLFSFVKSVVEMLIVAMSQ